MLDPKSKEENEWSDEENAKDQQKEMIPKKKEKNIISSQTTENEEDEDEDDESELEGDHCYNVFDEFHDTCEREESLRRAASYDDATNVMVKGMLNGSTQHKTQKAKNRKKKFRKEKKPTLNVNVEQSDAPSTSTSPSLSQIETEDYGTISQETKAQEKEEGMRRVSSKLEYVEEREEITPMHDVLESTMYEERVQFCERKITPELLTVSSMLAEALEMRKKYVKMYYPWEDYSRVASTTLKPTNKVHSKEKLGAEKTEESFYMRKGIMTFAKPHREKFKVPVSYLHHYKDFKKLRRLLWHAATKSFCHHRLQMLELKFSLYRSLCQRSELSEQKNVPHRDFYNVRKVDNHIHCSSSMNQKHLLRFIKRKLKDNAKDKVYVKDGTERTLEEVCDDLGLNPYDLSVDSLEVHAAGEVVRHRFDKFNSKYNPFGVPQLREIFLKTDNHIKGKYFAEIVKETFEDLEESKYTHSEPRLSIYGRSSQEWNNLADWAIENDMFSDNIRWMIQIPRLFHLHKGKGLVETFEEMLENIFLPLFQVTRDPSSNPKLHLFLEHVVGFDHVDDESKSEGRFHSHLPSPDVWTKNNPPYAYYGYYMWANIYVLNCYRESKGYSTFQFRPHSGEAGDIVHLISTFLYADGIAHGIEVRRSPVLEYLYYLTQIGMSVSPLSNNHLFLKYNKSPFLEFFSRGHNVTLSTDDPLMFHFTKEALVEEYSIAAQVWHFTSSDLCEIARNSVLQSGWDHSTKQHWLGTNYHKWSSESNEIEKTNVPDLRMKYRFETLLSEHLFIEKCLHQMKDEQSGGQVVGTPPRLSREQLFYQIAVMKRKYASLPTNNPMNTTPVLVEPNSALPSRTNPFNAMPNPSPPPRNNSSSLKSSSSKQSNHDGFQFSWTNSILLGSLFLSSLSLGHLLSTWFHHRHSQS